jgi:hypothetical protein
MLSDGDGRVHSLWSLVEWGYHKEVMHAKPGSLGRRFLRHHNLLHIQHHKHTNADMTLQVQPFSVQLCLSIPTLDVANHTPPSPVFLLSTLANHASKNDSGQKRAHVAAS